MFFCKNKPAPKMLSDVYNTKQFDDGTVWFSRTTGEVIAKVYKVREFWYAEYNYRLIGEYIDYDAAKLAVEYYKVRVHK